MSTAQLKRQRGGQALLSDQAYREYDYEPQPPRRRSAPPITMEASEPFSIPFGSDGFFLFDSEPPAWFNPILDDICQLGELPANWNTYGAQQIDPQTAAYSITLLGSVLSHVDPLPSIVPTSRGGILIEWHIGGVDLEVDVRSPSSLHVAFEADGREEEFENADFELVQEKLNFLRGRL